MIDKEHILAEIKRTAEENGNKPLGKEKFKRETGIKQSDWYGKYWAKWSDAITEAGYEPNKLQSAYEDDFLIKKLIELIREIGHFPTAGERRLKAFQDKNFPSHSTFSKFGNKKNLIQTVLKYCKDNNVNNKIIEYCNEALRKSPHRRLKNIEPEENKFGFVYLMKSGKYYKIGRSDYPEMREYQIGIKLPEKIKIIHKIKTDDPVGIEKYWHERFKDKRKDGEWFDLTSSEITAFKRRKFM